MNRWFARLGEHDVRTEADGQHEDILITSKRVHPQYNKDLLIYDVSVLTLQRDVTFNGTKKKYIKKVLRKMLNNFDL